MKYFTFLALFLITINTFGQSAPSYTLKGVVKDSISGAPIDFATITLKRADNDKILVSTTTDNNGTFEFKRISGKQIIANISYMGYNSLEKKIIWSNETIIDLGDISLQENATRLSDVVVSAIGNPIVFKKDTIEYNASSYKVTENAVLEDLVKKLPGAEVDSDGKITVNGKEIKKVMIDGQVFFANDPQIASKNLPAKMVEKIQVVDRKSDQAQFTGIDDGNEETILNLTVKSGMKNGWMGNVSAGAGYKDRYQGGGFLARFDNNWQLSAIASGNNTNNRGFTDIAGSMMQSGRGSGRGGGGMVQGGGPGGGSRGGFNLNVGGVSMNIGGNGITTSWLGGLNGNIQVNKKLKIGGNYFYSGADNLLEKETARENIFVNNDDNFFYNQQARSQSKTEGHRAALEFEYTLDSLNSFLFKPNFSTGYGSFDEESIYASIKSNLIDTINYGLSSATGDNDYLSTSGDLLWRHKFNQPGRTFSANFTYGYNNNNTDGINMSLTHAFVNDSTNLINQNYKITSNGYNVGGRIAHTEPLGNNYFVELAYSVKYSEATSDKKTYDIDPISGDNNFNPLFSSNYENIFINQTGEINFRSVKQKYNYVIGINMQPYYMQSKNSSAGTLTDITRSDINFAPMAQFIYNYSDFQQLRINYRANTRQPSTTQLQPVPDNSDPLFINLGNPNLAAEFAHNLTLMYRDTDTKTFRAMFTFFNAAYTIDKIVNASLYDSSGRQTTIPVNTDGVYSLNGRFMINTPIKKQSKFFIMSNTSVNFNQTISYTGNVDEIKQDSKIDDLLKYAVRNQTQNLNITEMLRLNYKPNKLDIGVFGRANWTQAWYSVDNRASTNYWSNSVGGDFNWSLPWDFTLASDVNYNFYINYTSGYDQPMCIWNAELSKQLFKNKQGTISAKVYDILNEGRGTSRTTTNNYIEDITTNTLGRYVMLAFTYRFGSFGGQTQGGGQRGPGGMRFRGGPPM